MSPGDVNKPIKGDDVVADPGNLREMSLVLCLQNFPDKSTS